MKKALIILLTAALATTAASAAACSKGQTGSGNNTIRSYTLSEEDSTEEIPEGEETLPPEDENHENGCDKHKHPHHKKDKHDKPGFLFEVKPRHFADEDRKKPAPIPPKEESQESETSSEQLESRNADENSAQGENQKPRDHRGHGGRAFGSDRHNSPVEQLRH